MSSEYCTVIETDYPDPWRWSLSQGYLRQYVQDLLPSQGLNELDEPAAMSSKPDVSWDLS